MKTSLTFGKALFIGLLATITACTSIPNDSGVGAVQELVDAQIGSDNPASELQPEIEFTQEQVSELLDSPLTADDAELLSMQLNPRARSNLLQVGIAEADYAQAGRLRNPGFSYERTTEGDYSYSLLFDIGGLLLMPLRREVELRRLEAARYDAAGAVIEHLANTRISWFEAVAEQQLTQLVRRSLESAATANDMTRQMAALGHSAISEAAESEIFLGEMRSALTRQMLSESAARESLIRQLGFWGQSARKLTLPERLPQLPESLRVYESVEGEAIERRIDVQIANANLEAMASNYDLTRLNPFLSSIELGPTLEKAGDETERGFELEFSIPIFDAGGINNEKARFLFEQSQAQAQSVAIAAASQAREALQTYRSYWDIARHYKEVLLPLRRRVSDEKLLHYNGMLISVFDLLDDVRAAGELEASAIRAVRDFWLADARLQLVLTGSSPGMMMTGAVSMPSSGSTEEH
jgi:outer membrane protein TolC